MQKIINYEEYQKLNTEIAVNEEKIILEHKKLNNNGYLGNRTLLLIYFRHYKQIQFVVGVRNDYTVAADRKIDYWHESNYFFNLADALNYFKSIN